MKGEVSIMTKETLKLIHRSYQEALEMSENILETVQNLYNILDELQKKILLPSIHSLMDSEVVSILGKKLSKSQT